MDITVEFTLKNGFWTYIINIYVAIAIEIYSK